MARRRRRKITPPYQKRILAERKALDARIIKLENFIMQSPKYDELTREEQRRLRRQCTVMTLYSDILGDRVEAFPK